MAFFNWKMKDVYSGYRWSPDQIQHLLNTAEKLTIKRCSLKVEIALNTEPYCICLFFSRTAYSYPESQLYGQGSGSTYFDTQAGGTPVTTIVSSAGGMPTHSMVGIMDVGSSQIISSGSAYLIHGGMESGRHHTSHSSRSSSAMVWFAVLKSIKTDPLVTWEGSF